MESIDPSTPTAHSWNTQLTVLEQDVLDEYARLDENLRTVVEPAPRFLPYPLNLVHPSDLLTSKPSVCPFFPSPFTWILLLTHGLLACL
ncbi:Bgt-8 [Blumeria graminis f. sp. tritici]|uniref:Uncharacterized protein n=3 Tax=Blumeria graminis f. sp. tritici TaxID=62690 RepID=A0A656KFA7_BLUGR|nr:hypothetical protein BGT96224_8 [Blumeria graminis f. sp. tritici 96224]VDB89744.1 Bgt-8 [Blumeria graminis f. sp. tritici]